MRVNYGQSVHDSQEINAVVNVLKTSTQMGKSVRELESKISTLFCKKYGMMVNSGSSALIIAFEVLNFPKGSEVLTTALTFGTTVSSIIKANLKPRFVDVKSDTLCIDEDLIERNITKRTKAICIPNLVGNLPNWKKIKRISKKYNLVIIEDSADTLGATFDKKYSGFFSDISITSFYGSHIINGAGNGGMLCINNKKLYEKALLLRSWGRSSSLFIENSEKIENRFDIKLDGIEYDKKFVFEIPGYNLEPSEVSAAFALVQLRKLKTNISKRIKNFNLHYNFFKQYDKFFNLPFQYKNVKTAWLAYPVIIRENDKFTRKELQIFLEKKDIQTRVIFTGNILRQPGFKNLVKKSEVSNFSEADLIMKYGMLIGCHQGLTLKQIRYVHNSINEFLKKYT